MHADSPKSASLNLTRTIVSVKNSSYAALRLYNVERAGFDDEKYGRAHSKSEPRDSAGGEPYTENFAGIDAHQ